MERERTAEKAALVFEAPQTMIYEKEEVALCQIHKTHHFSKKTLQRCSEITHRALFGVFSSTKIKKKTLAQCQIRFSYSFPFCEASFFLSRGRSRAAPLSDPSTQDGPPCPSHTTVYTILSQFSAFPLYQNNTIT